MLDLVNNIIFSQTDNAKKPLLKRNPTKKLNYIEFDGTDDYLIQNQFDASSLAGPNGNTMTFMMIVNVKTIKPQTQLIWIESHNLVKPSNFGIYIAPKIDEISAAFGQETKIEKQNEQNLTGNIEVWTVRVNGSLIQLFRGVSSLTPIKNQNITQILDASGRMSIGGMIFILSDASNYNLYSKMDLYGLSIWSKSLSDDELKNMFRFIQNYYDL